MGNKEYYWKNRERILNYWKEYRKRPEVKEKIKKYYQENKEKIRKQQTEHHKEYYQRPEVKEKMKVYYRRYMKKYAKEHPKYRKNQKIYKRKYYKEKWKTDKNYRNKEYIRNWHGKNKKYYLKKFNNKCVKCGSTENLELHHLKYEAKRYSNKVIILCKKCHHKEHINY